MGINNMEIGVHNKEIIEIIKVHMEVLAQVVLVLMEVLIHMEVMALMVNGVNNKEIKVIKDIHNKVDIINNKVDIINNHIINNQFLNLHMNIL